MSSRTFNLRQTKAYAAVRMKQVIFGPASIASYALVLTAIGSRSWSIGDWTPFAVSAVLLGWSLFVLGVFRKYKLANNAGTPSKSENLAELLSYHMVKHLVHEDVSDGKSLLRAACKSDRGLFVLHSIGVEPTDVFRALDTMQGTLDMAQCLQWALSAREELKAERIDSTLTICAFFVQLKPLQQLLAKADLALTDLQNILACEVFHYQLWLKRDRGMSPETLVRILGAFGRTWVSGYTNDLDRLTTDLTERAGRKQRYTVIHRDAVERMLAILLGNVHRNTLIIGRPGVGKRTLVDNVAHALHMSNLEHDRAFTRILQLNTAVLVAGVQSRDRFLLSALEHAEQSGKFVLTIEDIAMLLKASDAGLKEVFLKLLQAQSIRTIGIIDARDYHLLVKTDPLIDTLFEKIYLEDIDNQDTLHVLLEHSLSLEQNSRMRMSYKALQSVIELSARYISKVGMPGKAVEILDAASLVAAKQGSQTISEEHIRTSVSEKANIDVQRLNDSDRTRLLELESKLKGHIVGQDEAIRVLTGALKRAKLDLHAQNRPLGTFLFLGPTGVGKTETAKALAMEYFGSEQHFVRIDLNEYGSENSASGIIGSTDGKESSLVRKVQDYPFCLLLLDEIEKAHPKVLNIFLQILDEGFLIDALGNRTDFRNTIIIATSNAAGLFIRDRVKQESQMTQAELKKAVVEEILKERLFSPEFINRFDDVLLYMPLSKVDVRTMAIRMIDAMVREIDAKKGIGIRLEPAVLDYLVEKGYSIEFGAREMRRTITETIENFLADYLLKNTVQRGGEVFIHLSDISR